MLRAKVTSKGQITIPAKIRKELNLKPGDEIIFDFSPGGEVKIKVYKRKKLTDLYASLPANRPYPGKEEVRKEAAANLAKKILGKEK